MSTKISSSNIQAGTLLSIVGPKIISITYPGDDTAADPTGAQTITMTGSGFNAGLVVYLGGIIVGVTSVVSSTQVTFVTPAKTAGNYTLVLVNTDGGTATFIPGIQYSGVPTWSTGAGTLATVYETAAISNTLAATSDSAMAYTVSSGTIPATTALNSSTGVLSGTAPVVASSTTYNFTVDATDAENQNTGRNFSYTINPDVVTWSSPAAGATLETSAGAPYSQALSATSAAEKSITYTANALPAGLSISGANITGTPSAASAISSLLTATAAITGKTATRAVVWNVTTQPAGQIAYTTAGTYSWIAPAGVTSVSAVAVGGGGGGKSWNGNGPGCGGGGGALAYANSIAVIPGNSYSITVGTGGAGVEGSAASGVDGGNSSFSTMVIAAGGKGGTQSLGGAGGTVLAGTGGTGGAGGNKIEGSTGGGGAAGYSGAGGVGGNSTAVTAGSGSGGGAGGGGGGSTVYTFSQSGAGVGIFGQGANGAGGRDWQGSGITPTGGSGGSAPGANGGNYGGGGAGAFASANGGGGGAVRIIWGSGRAFPSTLTTDQ
jgi:hypothetical protein